MTVTRNSRLALAHAALVRSLILAALWWVLSEGETASWSVGVVVVGLTTAASLALAPAPLPRPRLLPLLRFVPFFIAKSFLGGVDVVRRACYPVPRVAPTMKTCSLADMSVAERVAFVIIFALFPGTLCVRLEEETLRFHVLDEAMPVMDDFAALEARLAPIFGRVPERRPTQHGPHGHRPSERGGGR
jgi:multicomponent Na+:H+ antiporter subunit E